MKRIILICFLSLTLSAQIPPQVMQNMKRATIAAAVSGGSSLAMNQVTSATLSNWFDISDHSTVYFSRDDTSQLQTTNGGQIAHISDKGNGAQILKGDYNGGAPATTWPTLNTSAQNSKWGIQFDRTSVQDLYGGTSQTINQPLTLAVVFKSTTASANQCIVGYGNSPANFLLYKSSGNAYGSFAGTGVTWGTSDTAAHIIIFVQNRTTSKYAVDGGTFTAITGDPGTAALIGACLGNNASGGSYPFSGTISEVGIFSGTISDSEAAALMNGLNTKWSLY